MKAKRRDTRIGTVLVCVLACGLIAITLGACAIRLAVGSARASKQTLRLRQTQWLLDAGVGRSQLRISNGNFEDELWQLSAEVLMEARGTVHIQVENADSDSVLITVTAEYGPELANESTIRRSYAYRQPRINVQERPGD